MDFGFSIGTLLLWLMGILIAISVHEATHAYVGLKLGDDSAAQEGRVSLNPLRHIDPVMTVLLPALTLVLFHVPFLAARPVPFDPYRVRHGEFGAALIAVAGPISNLILAIGAAAVLHLFTPVALVGEVLFMFVTLNVALFIFNLIPIPPLDGSRVLYAFAPEAVQNVLAQIEPYGLFIVLGLVLLGHFGDILIKLNDSVLQLLL